MPKSKQKSKNEIILQKKLNVAINSIESYFTRNPSLGDCNCDCCQSVSYLAEETLKDIEKIK